MQNPPSNSNNHTIIVIIINQGIAIVVIAGGIEEGIMEGIAITKAIGIVAIVIINLGSRVAFGARGTTSIGASSLHSRREGTMDSTSIASTPTTTWGTSSSSTRTLAYPRS